MADAWLADPWSDGQSLACQLAVSRNNLASVLARKGELSEAIEVAQEAIAELQSTIRAGTDPAGEEQLAIMHNNLGMLLWQSNSGSGSATPEMAVSAFQTAEKTLRNHAVRSNRQPESLNRLAGVLHNLGQVQESLGEPGSAIVYLTEALELQAQAVKQAPFDRVYRDHLERHRELLDQILRQLKDSPATQRNETVEQGTNASWDNRAAGPSVQRSVSDA